MYTQPSRTFYTPELAKFSEKLCTALGYDLFLPSSGGTEACESACKLARRWGYVVKGVEPEKAEILMTNGCFWGRSITACSGSDDLVRFRNFGPLTPGFPLVPYNDVDAVEEYFKANPNCCAIMVEPIQGEAGIIVPDPDYLTRLKAVCEKYNCLLLADEVQTGMGRTGKLMGFMHEDVKPDVVTIAKSISGGITPLSGIVADKELMDLIKPGEHGSTFGGNPLSMAVGQAALEVLIEEKLPENAVAMGEVFNKRLSKLQSPILEAYRWKGLFHGFEFKNTLSHDAFHFVRILRENGLLTRVNKTWIVRFLPPLNIKESEVHEGCDIIEKSFYQYEELVSK